MFWPIPLSALLWAAEDPLPPAPTDFALSASTEAAEAGARRRGVLAEMWERRILSPAMDRWSSSEEELLLRMRRAEASGAIELLRDQAGPLRGLAVEHQFGPGERRVRLTRAGFNRYLFLKSQKALKYFNRWGVDPKYGFWLKTERGKRVFDGQGVLTRAGEELYDRILTGEKVRWRERSGRTGGNFRPSPGPVTPL